MARTVTDKSSATDVAATGDITSATDLTTLGGNQVVAYLEGQGLLTEQLLAQLDTAPAIFLNEVEGAMIAFRFKNVTLAEISEYGPAPLITFTALAGHFVHSKSGPVDVVPDGEYAMYLFSQVLHNTVVEFAPEPGELMVIRYGGTRPSGSRADKDGEPVEYHQWAVVMPERPQVVETVTWGSIALKGKTR